MRFTAFKDLTRLEQTLFGLPFVLGGALLAFRNEPKFAPLLWIIPAFLAARISGMAFNQWIDREFDARNPRTQNRVFPTGRVTSKQAASVAWGGLVLFVALGLQINPLTALLALVAAVLITVYSFLKRVTASCHFVMGLIHCLAPIMAYAAMTGKIGTSSVFLGAAAAFSIIGTDIGYAIQDYAFDCKEGLFSFPSRMGIKTSLFVIGCAHVLSPLMLLGVGWTAHLPWIYYLVLPVVAVFFGHFNWQLRKNLRLHGSLQRMAPSFFICAASVSSVTLIFILLGVLWDVMS